MIVLVCSTVSIFEQTISISIRGFCVLYVAVYYRLIFLRFFILFRGESVSLYAYASFLDYLFRSIRGLIYQRILLSRVYFLTVLN